MKPIYITYLNGLDIEALAITDDEILTAIETSLGAQGRGETVIEPRMHLEPKAGVHGHFNVLRGAIGSQPSERNRFHAARSSTPSATTLRPRLWPRLMVDRTMVDSSSSLAICCTNERSIFSSCTGRRMMYDSDEYPVP